MSRLCYRQTHLCLLARTNNSAAPAGPALAGGRPASRAVTAVPCACCALGSIARCSCRDTDTVVHWHHRCTLLGLTDADCARNHGLYFFLSVMAMHLRQPRPPLMSVSSFARCFHDSDTNFADLCSDVAINYSLKFNFLSVCH